MNKKQFNKSVIVLTTTILMLTLVACGENKQRETTPAPTQQSNTVDNHSATAPASLLPAFAMEDTNGRRINLQSFAGKKVFVNLWASWCPPCRAEMPSIEKLSKLVDTSKAAFVMLSLDDNFTKARKFVRSQKLGLPIYYPAENLPALFNVLAIPSTFIFGEDGNLIKQIDGADNYNTDEYKTLLK